MVLKGNNILVIWNSALTNVAAQIAANAVVNYAVTSTGTVTYKDYATLTEAQSLTYVGTLVAGTYDHIFMYVDIGVAGYGGTGKITYDHMKTLALAMTAAGNVMTVVASGTAQAGAVGSITLATTASAVNGTYTNMAISITAGTDVGDIKWCTGYTGASKIATVDASHWAVTVDNTSKYAIGYLNGLHQFFNVDIYGQNLAIRTWNIAYPGVTMPLPVKYIGAGGFAECSGNLQAYTAGTPSVTLPAAITVGDRSIGHTVDGYYNGMFGYVYSATTGENQSFEIVSYVGATNVATIKTAFPVALSGTMVVRIMDNDRELFYDVAMKIAINTYLTDPTNLDWGKMFDMNGTLNNTNDNPVQDLKTLKKYLDKGKAAYDAISAAVTAIPV